MKHTFKIDDHVKFEYEGRTRRGKIIGFEYKLPHYAHLHVKNMVYPGNRGFLVKCVIDLTRL